MRHRVAGKKMNRSSGHRKALRRNLISALFQHGSIRTTEARAKFIRGEAEKLITLAKRGDLHARRQALANLPNRGVIDILFDELGPRFQDRTGGYTRIYKLGPRQGDGAPMATIELVE